VYSSRASSHPLEAAKVTLQLFFPSIKTYKNF
jgi:hypothetical protein